jgi:transcriptional regulator
MRYTPHYLLNDPDEFKRLIRENPWATIVSPTSNGIVASHYPELLSEEENFDILGHLVDHFEQRMPQPMSLQIDESAARHIATGTVGLRLRVSRFDARLKLSQNRDPAVVERIVGHLEADGPYSSAPLAAEMRRAHAVAP